MSGIGVDGSYEHTIYILCIRWELIIGVYDDDNDDNDDNDDEDDDNNDDNDNDL